jgi:hypothetical protein
MNFPPVTDSGPRAVYHFERSWGSRRAPRSVKTVSKGTARSRSAGKWSKFMGFLEQLLGKKKVVAWVCR